MKTKSVLFDFDGTLADMLPLTYHASTCGDINPGNGTMVLRGDDTVDVQIGIKVGSTAKDIEASSLLSTADPPSNGIATLERAADREKLDLGCSLPEVEGEWHRIQLSRIEQLQSLEPHVPLDMTLLTVADRFSLLGMNAEVVVEYGLYVKRLSGGCVLLMGYTNGMFGYLTTARQLEEGGYEADSSTLYFAMASKLHFTVEDVTKKALDALLQGS